MYTASPIYRNLLPHGYPGCVGSVMSGPFGWFANVQTSALPTCNGLMK